MVSCGLDFGTSNSVIYITDSGLHRPVFVHSEPTVLFFPEDTDTYKDFYVGFEAIEFYIASGMKGRFFQSIKSLLNDKDYLGTEIGPLFYTLVDLLDTIISHFKAKAEQFLGEKLTTVTIGRPVYFSEDAERDALAQDRLLKAAKRAGFSDIAFQLEPIAAALAYETTLKKQETVLVADFGGGTTDFTIMKLSPGEKSGNRTEDIIATGGVYIGGDTFDARIMWEKLTPYFGNGSYFKDLRNRYEVPRHFYYTLCAWADIARLKTKTYQEQLREINFGAEDKPAIKRLITLINQDLGFAVFKSIEKAKKDLTQTDPSQLLFSHTDIAIQQELTQSEFSSYINHDCEAIQKALADTFKRAGCRERDIDTVFLTGGSSLVRRVRRDFESRFSKYRLNSDLDLFTSVAQGLARGR